jgi:hypothetical protein
MMEKYDTNKDGKIDDEERAKIPRGERFMGGPGGPGGRTGGRTGGNRPSRGGNTPKPPAPETK